MNAKVNDFELALELAAAIRNDRMSWYSSYTSSTIGRRVPHASPYQLAALLESAAESRGSRLCATFEVGRGEFGSSWYVFLSDGELRSWHNAVVLPDPQLRVDKVVAAIRMHLDLITAVEPTFHKGVFGDLKKLEEEALCHSGGGQNDVCNKSLERLARRAAVSVRRAIRVNLIHRYLSLKTFFGYMRNPSEETLQLLEESALMIAL